MEQNLSLRVVERPRNSMRLNASIEVPSYWRQTRVNSQSGNNDTDPNGRRQKEKSKHKAEYIDRLAQTKASEFMMRMLAGVAVQFALRPAKTWEQERKVQSAQTQYTKNLYQQIYKPIWSQ